MKYSFFKFDKELHNNQSFVVILNTKDFLDITYTYNGYEKKGTLVYVMIDGQVKVMKFSKGQINRIQKLFPFKKFFTEKYAILKTFVEKKEVEGIDRSFIDVTHSLIDITDNLVYFDKDLKPLIEKDTLNKVYNEYFVEDEEIDVL